MQNKIASCPSVNKLFKRPTFIKNKWYKYLQGLDSDDAWPIMDLNVGLQNIHCDKYIARAYEILKRIGVEVRATKQAA